MRTPADLTRGHTADPRDTRAALSALRPDLLPGYDAALPQARADILARLVGAFAREPMAGVTTRRDGDTTVRVRLRDGRWLCAPAPSAALFATVDADLQVQLDAGDAPASAPPRGFVDPAALLRAVDLPGAARLAVEVDNSVANLALARAQAAVRTHIGPVLRPADSDPDAAGRLEQLVTDGHPVHPCCRTRGSMSVADVLAYAPEHTPVIRPHRLRVPADRWYGDAPPVLLAHPWQAQRVRAAYPWLRDDGRYGPTRPLMSLRTLAPLDGGEHIKTAVDVQMTSAVRTVSPAAVHNGPRLSALLHTLTADLPTLTVLGETAAGAVIVDGSPHRGLSHLRRQAPTARPGEVVVPIAVLTAASPADGRPLLAELVDGHGGDPYAWLRALTAVLLPPLLRVLHRGVALEAHGQNTLVVLRGADPVRILYRDLGGVRVNPARLRAVGMSPPPLHGDLCTDDIRELRTTVAASALAVLLGEQIALLHRGYDADPAALWRHVADVVRATNTPDSAALLGDPLPIKATTAMRLAADPLEPVWAYLDNPLAVSA